MSHTSKRDMQRTLSVLQRAVDKALDRKRRLGQYAVFWKDGHPVFTEGDRPDSNTSVEEPPAPYNPDTEQ